MSPPLFPPAPLPAVLSSPLLLPATAQHRTPGQGFPERCQVPQCSGSLTVQSNGEGGLLSGPSWGRGAGGGGRGTDRIQGRLSLGLSSMGQEAPVLLFIYFFLLYSSRLFKGVNLEPDAPVSLLPVLCIIDLLICKLGTVFHLVLLCCVPQLKKDIAANGKTPAYMCRQNACWPPASAPRTCRT